ncbi:MAG: hypothetical protein J6X59_03860 [Bacteroidales bacterium]|nr:hypothetical protein [Bacteroidales bacterium]
MEEKDQYYMQEVTQYVASTGKWYRFFGVLSIIGAVLMVLAGLALLIYGIVEGNRTHYSYGFYGGYSYQEDTTTQIVMGITYILLSGLVIPVAVFLNRGASAAKRCVETSDNEQAVLFLKNTKSYWKFQGIFTIVILSLYILAFLVGIIAAVVD